MKKLLIYNPNPTKRSSYIFELMFNQIIGISAVEETKDLLLFQQTKGVAKLNYSNSNMINVLFFIPDKFMEEKTVRKFKPEIKTNSNLPAAFFHTNEKAVLPFDVFAFCFYLVSRYEEYLDFEKDEHRRFTAHQSLAYQHEFLDKPIVNLWAKKLAFLLQKSYPTLEFFAPKYTYTPTYDIDYAYAFLQKGLLRQTGAFFKNLKNRDYETLKMQLKTWFRIQKDPYFVFDYLKELDTKYELKPTYFWLVGNYGTYDKNIHYKNSKFQQLIAQNASDFPIGIHPSYRSNASANILDKEIARLEEISTKKIVRSRQHYLRLHLPDTYEDLVHYKIEEDYTMGYAQELGFRASIATPFYWFNLRKNKKENLLVYPFQIMDVTLQTYLKLAPAEAIEKLKPIIQNTKAVNGHLISIWHNSSLCEAWDWKGWRAVYEELLKISKE